MLRVAGKHLFNFVSFFMYYIYFFSSILAPLYRHLFNYLYFTPLYIYVCVMYVCFLSCYVSNFSSFTFIFFNDIFLGLINFLFDIFAPCVFSLLFYKFLFLVEIVLCVLFACVT